MAKDSLSWQSILDGPTWRLSPGLADWQKKIIKEMQARVPRELDGLWLLSSGTQSVGEVKAIALQFDAFMESARAVNAHLGSGGNDHWLLTLPLFHVGGLGILARAKLSGAKVTALPKWNARSAVELIESSGVTLSALVPTQIFDLVGEKLRAPASLRAVIVGGAALDPELYTSARSLGWPLLPSYGLTECASQVATASLASLRSADVPVLEILPHAQVRVRVNDGILQVASKSLASFVARGRRDGQFTLEVPAPSGWLTTEDLAQIENGNLRPLGRRDDVVKVLGELVSIPQLEAEARTYFAKLGGDLTILAVAGGRAGHDLILVTNSKSSLREWHARMLKFNIERPGPTRLAQLFWIDRFPTSDLGKLKKAELAEKLNL